MTKNKVTLILSQHIPSAVRDNGTLIPEFNNTVEFESETAMEVTTGNVANWCVCVLKKYLSTQRLQGKTGFKLSKDINVTFKVNHKQESSTMKFSLNTDRLENIFARTPKLLEVMFTPVPNVGGLTTEKAQKFLFSEGKTILAIAKSKKEAVTPALLTGIEDAEIVGE